jgi:hypothetical protein
MKSLMILRRSSCPFGMNIGVSPEHIELLEGHVFLWMVGMAFAGSAGTTLAFVW